MGIANYFDGDPDFTAAQEDELIRLAQALRVVLDRNMRLNAPLEVLRDLADSAEALAERMAPHSSVRAMASHNRIFKREDASWSSPYSPVVGRCNPLAAPMRMCLTDDKAIGTVTFGDAYEGPPNCVHGGMVALTWDHVMALANMLINARGPTAWLHVEYRKPTPLYTPLRFEAWIDRLEGKKIFIKGVCYANDEVVTEASGLFINTIIKNIGVEGNDLFQQTPITTDTGNTHGSPPANRFTAD